MLKNKTKLQSATIFKNANLLSLFSIGKKLREKEFQSIHFAKRSKMIDG